MIDIDEAQVILDVLAEELPEGFFHELNEGLLLLPQEKLSPYAKDNDLYILGENQSGSSMDRLINIYYGSY